MPQEKSELLKKETPVDSPKYSNEESAYIGRILYRMLKAKTERDSVKSEFNDMAYLQWYTNNENLANTKIKRDETNKNLAVMTGTVEQKMQSILAEINLLNLTGEVRVFDKDNDELQELGHAITDIVHKTEEIEGDLEHKEIRQLELLKQGTVFFQDNWIKKWKSEKKFSGKFTGKVTGSEWTTKLEKVFDGPVRSVLYGPGVYYGNIREFTTKLQPFIFTMKLSSYQEVKTRYGATDKDGKDMWERWKNVPKMRVSMVDMDNVHGKDVGQGWSITDIEDEMVEEIHYQDQINNEYQIFLNGIAMLPVGFPLSEITPNGMFNVEKQVLQVINPFFLYGRSFPSKTEQLSALLDEMLKLLLIKTRKSIHPPYANISGKVISEKSLMPGAISMGIDPGALIAIGNEGQGATASEYQMLKELRENLDRVTLPPQTQGQSGKSGTTAFEVGILQQQAQKTLTLIIFAMGLLEKKVTWLRANYIMAYYFEPVGTKVSDMQDKLENVYRSISTQTTIQGKGLGVRKVIPVQNAEGLTDNDVFNKDEFTGTPIPEDGSRRRTRGEMGMDPIQHLFINLDILKNAKYIFFTEVESKPRDTSINSKLMFREELKDLQVLGAMGSSVNVESLENDYALIWGKRKGKTFGKPRPAPKEGEEGALKSSGNIANVLGANSPTPTGAQTI